MMAVPKTESHGSWWPLVVGTGAMLTLLGVLVPPLGLLGAVTLVGGVAGWVREDLAVRPTAQAGHGDRWWAVLFLIVGEVVLFGTLFTYYFWAKAHAGSWLDLEGRSVMVALANTVLLLTSGWTAHGAHKALEAGDAARFRRGLFVTLVLGLLFLSGQAYEYITAPFGPTTHAFGTAFYALTGVHGLHVAAGLGVLGSMLVLAVRGRIGTGHAKGVGAAVLYWHFVDVVWLAILGFVYLG